MQIHTGQFSFYCEQCTVCQLKTSKIFILMVKPSKPLFLRKTFMIRKSFQHFCCIGRCPLKCTLGRNSGTFGVLRCFQMIGYMGQLGLACSWIPRREMEPQLIVAPQWVVLLKQTMSWFLKPKAMQKKTVAELLKFDMKHSDSQLKDSELQMDYQLGKH